MKELLPSGYTLISATPSGSTTYDQDAGIWNIGTLSEGSKTTLNLIARVNPGGNYENTVSISSTEKDG